MSISPLKYLLPICCLLFFTNCKKDKMEDDDVMMSSEFELLKINVSDDYLIRNAEEDRFATVYFTDSRGELITSVELENDNAYTIMNEFDPGSEIMDATFVVKTENSTFNYTSYFVQTFTDINPHTLDLYRSPSLYLPNEQADITINNTGSLLENISSHNIGTSSWVFNNGGIYEAKVSLKSIPENIYAAFLREQTGEKFYLWLEGATGSTMENYDLYDLPLLTNSKQIVYPENENLVLKIEGWKNGNENESQGILKQSLFQGETEIEVSYPEDLFDEFRISSQLTTTQGIYYKNSTTSNITDGFILPNLDFTIVNNSIGNFEFNSDSDYNFYTANFSVDNQPGNFSFYWTMSGKGAPTINFALPKIEALILEDFPNLGRDDIKFQDASVIKYTGLNDYEDFIQSEMVFGSPERKQITKEEVFIKN